LQRKEKERRCKINKISKKDKMLKKKKVDEVTENKKQTIKIRKANEKNEM